MANKDELEVQEFIDSLTGTTWKGLALSQYMLSIQEKKTHKEAMKDMTDMVIKVAKCVTGETNK